MATIGIDLGTTNSLAACWRDGEARLIENGLGELMTPSVVGLDEDGTILVGTPARDRLISRPDRTAANFKRYMGSARELKLGKRRFRPEELSSFVLRSLKEDAEALLGEPVTEAVISVPAYFSDAQRKATRAAGQLAGLTVERLINEPTAAAIAYGLHQRDAETTFLVFDLGGGTFDVSVLELFDGVMEVHASAGDNFLGGEDFVEMLTEDFCKRCALARRSLDSGAAARLARAVEECKRALSRKSEAPLAFRSGKTECEYTYTRAEFERIVAPLVQRLRDPVERALRDASLKAGDLDSVVLVGGASIMPLVRSLVARLMGQIPAAHINPDHVVALGTAVQVGLKARDSALSEVVLTDVCPYTLGTEVSSEFGGRRESGLFHPIIERNSTVPVSRMDTFYTASDYQREVLIGIYQGEARKVKDNVKLGELTVNVPSAKAGEQSIDTRFTYDINGILEVEAVVNATGAAQRTVIEGNPGVMTPEEIEKRLAELAAIKIHPRDKLENTALMARGERLYEQALGERREYIARLILEFEQVLERQDPKAVETTRGEITRIFDGIEADSVF